MIRKIVPVLSLLYFFYFPTNALADTNLRSDQVAEPKPARDPIVVKPLLRVPQYSIRIEPKENDAKDQAKDQDLEYSPAIQPEFGLSVSWKDVTLTGTVPMPRDSEEDEKTGVTKYRDYKFDYRRGIFGFDLGYQEYQGFYREQSKKSDSPDQYEKRPDLRKRSQYVNLFYFPFGDSLSKADLISPKEHTGSPFGWSPVLQIALDRTSIGGEKPLIGSNQLAFAATSEGNFRTGIFDSYGGAMGLAGSWTKPSYNIYGALSVGSMYQRQSYELMDETKYRQGQAERVAFRSAFTYYYDDFSTGITIMYDQTEIPLKEIVMTSSVGDVTIFVGKAF